MSNLYIVPMPLNKDGDGPECNWTKLYDVVFLVWNTDHETVAEFKTRAEAEKFISDTQGST